MIRLVEENCSIAEIIFSVKINIDYILNTRNTLSVHEFLSLPIYNVNSSIFGLPNINRLTLANQSDIENLCLCIKRALNLFEPRFVELEVTFQNYNKYKRIAQICASGRIDSNNATINLFLHVAVWKFNCE
jgi:type VI secretion system lysozyme-like protein